MRYGGDGGRVMSGLTDEEVAILRRRYEANYGELLQPMSGAIHAGDAWIQKRHESFERISRRIKALAEIRQLGGVTLRLHERLTPADCEVLKLESA